MRFLPAAAAVTAVAAVLSGCGGPGQVGPRPAGNGAGLGIPAAPPSAGPVAPPGVPPTFIDRGPPYRLVNVAAALAGPALDPARRAQLSAEAQRTHAIARRRGTDVTLAR
ncbi:hypothetical protein [Actinomadura rudentiformis]|uniref:Uncharacterized protein n=1 Tax=Actinomadura rudentiformis TaxID=359158 RepID=A0A6H9YJE7_9ACTN|nr:hypothetical protein [Actinomadura rudentiformis]KAB2341060.1 hypothetical protein F8566_42975 [Actinomadura rudentiformis]